MTFHGFPDGPNLPAGTGGAAPDSAAPRYSVVWDGTQWVPELGGAGAGDAFGRQRVSQPEALFDAKAIIDNQPFLYDDAEVSGSGTGSTHSVDTASVVLDVSNTTAGNRVRQSKRRPAYQPGKSQLAFLTFTLGAAATGITRRVGLFDADNGLFLEQDSTGLRLVRRTSTSGSAVDNQVEQADWSQDVFADLDPTKSQILFIDYEWLGVGSVRMGFVIDGALRYAHYFLNANNLAGVYMSTPNLPARYELDNDGTGAAATFETICASIISEGGADATGLTHTVDRAASSLTTGSNTSIYGLVAIRLKAAALQATVRVAALGVMCTSTADYRWALILNPTIVGTALSWSDETDSAVQSATPGNGTTLTGGTLLASGYGSSTNQVTIPIASRATDFALGSLIDGTSDIVVLAIQNMANGADVYLGTLTYTEQV